MNVLNTVVTTKAVKIKTEKRYFTILKPFIGRWRLAGEILTIVCTDGTQLQFVFPDAEQAKAFNFTLDNYYS